MCVCVQCYTMNVPEKLIGITFNYNDLFGSFKDDEFVKEICIIAKISTG